jgi:hypothetical protein
VIGAVRAKPGGTRLLPLLREAAVPLALFSGLAHVGVAVVLGLMVLGVIPGGLGGALLLTWSVFSLLASLLGYRRMEERRRRRAVSALAVSGMQVLASRLIALYPRPVEDPVIAEVFELYRRAQASLEEGDYRSAGKTIERGVALADGLLVVGEGSVRAVEDETLGEGERSWN